VRKGVPVKREERAAMLRALPTWHLRKIAAAYSADVTMRTEKERLVEVCLEAEGYRKEE
jgi:hypothetical protein